MLAQITAQHNFSVWSNMEMEMEIDRINIFKR